MKTLRLNLLAAASIIGATILCPCGWAAFVYENAAEFTAAGDFDGDGRQDVVIVDRASGTYRIGYQLSPGNVTWASPRASGIEAVSSFGLGRLAATSMDALVFTAPEANRVNVFAAENPNVAGLPLSLFSSMVGPSLVVPMDIGGAGNNTAVDDLVIGSALNGNQPFQLEAARNQGTTLQILNTAILPAAPRRGNPVTFKTGAPTLAAMLVSGGANDSVKAYQLTNGAFTEVLNAAVGPPIDLDYTFGFFNSGSPLAQFLFYKPGTNGLMLRPVQEPATGVFTLAAGPTFNLGDVVRQAFTIPGAASPRLLVIFSDGGTARIYDFDGSNPPVLLQTLTATAGEAFTGAAALGGGEVMLFTGAPGGVSSGFRRYTVNGATYTLQSSGALPALGTLSRRANVMTFQFEPFVASEPNLLQSYNAGDWASLYVPQAGSQASVTFETFVSPQAGLGSPVTQTLSPINTLAQFSLVNQYREPISVFRLTPAIGSEIADASILPAPGTYKTSIQVSFQKADPQSRVYYRMNPASNWLLFTFPFRIFKDTTIWFYATPGAPGTPLKSAIRQAAYHFTELPQNLDSDGDGVPDYVEIAKGLDPASGGDADGDGYSDLDELTNGKNPGDPNDFPAGEPRQDLHGAVDLIQAPQAVDGVSGLAADCVTGTVLRAFDLTGNLLSVGSATQLSLPQLNGPAAVLSNVVVDVDMRLVAVATDPHFDIVTAQADKRIGRELIRLLDTTDFVDPVSMPHMWSGGDVSVEANLWITTTSNQLLNVTRKQIAGNLGVYDTLAAILVEKKVRSILLSRGQSQFAGLTLFPFRAGDAGRPTLAAEDLAALESETTNGLPGFQLSQILGAIETALAAAPPNDPAQLKALAWEIFRVSSASNNIPPGAQSWPFLPSPVNTLRDFLETGVVHSNYAASAVLAGLVAPAFAQAQAILNGIGGRPVVMVNLKVRPDTFLGGCVLLDTLDGTQTRSLLNASGAPFEFLDAFSLPPGTVLSVKGYSDVINLGCPGAALEVMEVTLFAPPQFTSEDLDGDLLPDALELALFGGLSSNGFGDFDGDGFSNLQEIFEGTDPNNKSSAGVQIVNLTLPAVQLQVAPAGQIKLQFQWPAVYANKVQFGVVGAPDLGTPFTYVPAVQSFLGNDTFELNLPDPGGAAFFYQIFVTLK